MLRPIVGVEFMILTAYKIHTPLNCVIVLPEDHNFGEIIL